MFFDFISEFQGQRYLIVLRCQSLRSTLTLHYNAVFDVFCACSRDDNSVRVGWVTKSLYTNLLNWGGGRQNQPASHLVVCRFSHSSLLKLTQTLQDPNETFASRDKPRCLVHSRFFCYHHHIMTSSSPHHDVHSLGNVSMSQENNIKDINKTGGFNMLIFFSYFTVNVSIFFIKLRRQKVK